MRSNTPTVAYVALGANLGDRAGNIQTAIDSLRVTPNITVTAVSSFIETPAEGGPPGSPPYLNAAAALQTTLTARELLNCLLEIEHSLGRTRRVKWEPRPIDLDLLLFGDHIVSSADLIVPHPLMHERRFVLKPLAEIAPEAVHPTLQMTVSGLLQNLG